MDEKKVEEEIKSINNRLNTIAKSTHGALNALVMTTAKLLAAKAVQDVINMAIYEVDPSKRDRLKELLSHVTPSQTEKIIDKLSCEEIQSTLNYLCSPKLMTPEERRKMFRLVVKDAEPQKPE